MTDDDPGTAADANATGESGTAVRRDRFSGGPAREFLSSLAADAAIFEADLAVDRAHTVMLAEQGIVDDTVAGEILTSLDDVEAAGHDALPDGEDVHEAIETAVIDRIGSDGGRMHTARSRNDEVATCIRYRLREDLLAAAEATIALREALVDVASEHTETVMPGYTHLQPPSRRRSRTTCCRTRAGSPATPSACSTRTTGSTGRRSVRPRSRGRRSISTAIGLPSCSGSTGPFATRRTRRPPATSSRRARPRARRSRRRCRGSRKI